MVLIRGISCTCLCATIFSTTILFVASTEEAMDEKTRGAEKAKASMDTPPPSEIDTALHRDSIIPDVLDRVPNYTAVVKWVGGVEAKLGTKLSPNAITQPPHLVSWFGNASSSSCNKDNLYFTMLLTGPDHPSRKTPTQREFLYWHRGNIPSSVYDQTKWDTIVEYLGPRPANGTGEHRFVLFVYQQPSLLKFDEPVINVTDYGDPWRIHWNTRQFAKKYKLGDPHAISYFFAEFEG